jgi:hypothetical protein
VVNYLKPTARIYWRCNPGLQDHGNEECKNIVFFQWNNEWHTQLANEYGFTIVEIGQDKNRIYAEWSRS